MIKKVLRNKRGIISVKKENEEIFYSLLNDYLKKSPTSEIYEYFEGKTKFYNTKEVLTNLNGLFDCLDDLYPKGIKNKEIILIIKDTNLNLEKQDTLNYLNEFKETKENNPNYKFTIFLLNSNILDAGEDYIYNFYELDKSEFSFIDGQINGICNLFYENKVIKLKLKYINGKKIEHIRYYKNGKIAFKYEIRDSLKHGNYEYYSKEGKKRLELSFFEGKKDGEVSYFDSLERCFKIEDFNKGLYLGKLEVDYFSDNSKKRLQKEYNANNFMYLKTDFIDDMKHGKEIFKAVLNGKIVDIYIHTYKEDRMEGYTEDLVYINNGKVNTIFRDYIDMENLNSLNITISKKNLIKRVKYFQKNDKFHGISIQENYLANDIEAIKLFENGIQIKDNKKSRRRVMSYYLEQGLLEKEEYEKLIELPFIDPEKREMNKIWLTIIVIILVSILTSIFLFKNNRPQKTQVVIAENIQKNDNITQSEKNISTHEVNNNQEKILNKVDSKNIIYETYYNLKYNFYPDYPNTNFKIVSSNADAIYLEDIYEKGISIAIFGEEIDQIYNIEDIYNFYKEKYKNTLGYNLLKKDFMVVTYSEGNNLVYQKTMNGPTDYSKISLVVKFPKEYEENISPIIDKIVKTMKLKKSTASTQNFDIKKINYLEILDDVYDQVINLKNEDYLLNFSKTDLAFIRNTLYARRGYIFKKKEYKNYFENTSWYIGTTTNQNILSPDEEKLANIIKKYETK